ncbi:hypothetical protein [Ornithinimicrobium pekingense]|uniref:DUF4190 domain-containing protein n=1 Tax=Ornithinimicrobium pekingense TaxID=384677 RepID=A0ABQ2FAE1_9MICO|nr:hypothetical protein [Ornithinimicrobium pekingense]GGK77264.1 hypothetical protein GCM10011509_27360 [Ornithinimicrobium pekingense]
MSALLGNALQGAAQVLLVGLVLGAGLPAVFALGIRALAWADGGDAEVTHGRPQPVGRLLAAVCFGLVAAGVLLGLAVIVSGGIGYELGLDGVVPTIRREE